MRNKSIKIMLADSQPLCLQGLRTIIEAQENMNVVAIANRQDDIIKSALDTNSDLLIIDPQQKHLDGFDTIRIIRERGFRGKIILLMSDICCDVYQQANKIKVDGYILKTATSDKLVKSINDVIKGSIYVDEDVEVALMQSEETEQNNQKEAYRIDQLSQREYEILRLVASGKNNKEIASQLFISEKTVKNHLTQIFKKLDVKDRVQATLFAVSHNIK